jgi:hypothetical protein
MVEAGMTQAVTNENSETDFDSLRMVHGVDCLIYISNSIMYEGKG